MISAPKNTPLCEFEAFLNAGKPAKNSRFWLPIAVHFGVFHQHARKQGWQTVESGNVFVFFFSLFISVTYLVTLLADREGCQSGNAKVAGSKVVEALLGRTQLEFVAEMTKLGVIASLRKSGNSLRAPSQVPFWHHCRSETAFVLGINGECNFPTKYRSQMFGLWFGLWHLLRSGKGELHPDDLRKINVVNRNKEYQGFINSHYPDNTDLYKVVRVALWGLVVSQFILYRA